MLVLRTILELTSNNTCAFNDVTGEILPNSYGQGGNISVGTVGFIRLKVANYSTITANNNPPSTGFIQYTEYLKTGGEAEIINNKTFVAGDYFVPQFTGLTSSDLTNWVATGYYVYPFTWLPTSSQVPLDITVSQLGQEGDDIEDNEYIYEYEVYDTTESGTTAASEGTTYIVADTANLSVYVTYNGNRYYGGETFTAIDSTNIVPTGGAVYAPLYASTTGYSTMTYYLNTLINQAIYDQIGRGSQDLVNQVYGNIAKIRYELEALSYSSKTQNVSLLYAWQTINLLTSRANQLLRPNTQ